MLSAVSPFHLDRIFSIHLKSGCCFRFPTKCSLPSPPAPHAPKLYAVKLLQVPLSAFHLPPIMFFRRSLEAADHSHEADGLIPVANDSGLAVRQCMWGPWRGMQQWAKQPPWLLREAAHKKRSEGFTSIDGCSSTINFPSKSFKRTYKQVQISVALFVDQASRLY